MADEMMGPVLFVEVERDGGVNTIVNSRAQIAFVLPTAFLELRSDGLVKYQLCRRVDRVQVTLSTQEKQADRSRGSLFFTFVRFLRVEGARPPLSSSSEDAKLFEVKRVHVRRGSFWDLGVPAIKSMAYRNATCDVRMSRKFHVGLHRRSVGMTGRRPSRDCDPVTGVKANIKCILSSTLCTCTVSRQCIQSALDDKNEYSLQ
jgi:hypothetical protein